MRAAVTGLAGLSLAVLMLPLAALLWRTSPMEVVAALTQPTGAQALWVSARTSMVALAVIVGTGTPLAWALSRARGSWGRLGLLAVQLPVVLPPAVLGVALLEAFGRRGVFGPALDAVGASVSFSASAVVMAQVWAGAPLFVVAAVAAFRQVDDDLLLVARTLGASRARAWWTVAVPVAAPGLAAGAALGWARALGELGATLMFAGSLPGRTRTLPLAILAALEGDLGVARGLAVVLLGAAVVPLAAMFAAGVRRDA